jgi:hypothetical protein
MEAAGQLETKDVELARLRKLVEAKNEALRTIAEADGNYPKGEHSRENYNIPVHGFYRGIARAALEKE